MTKQEYDWVTSRIRQRIEGCSTKANLAEHQGKKGEVAAWNTAAKELRKALNDIYDGITIE